MTKIKTSELRGAQLDWAVVKIEFPDPDYDDEWRADEWEFQPASSWSQGGPIVEREITTLERDGFGWFARSTSGYTAIGPTPLIAAMRCYVASKLGDEVEIPEELT